MSNTFSNTVYALITNGIFLASLLSLVASQLIKIAIIIFNGTKQAKNLTLVHLVGKTGGMPSSHAATSTALAVSVGIYEGFTTSLFVAMFFIASVIIRDAVGVRQAAGIQAKALNDMGAELAKNYNISFSPVKEIQGHTFLEVVVGIILGATLSVAIYFLLSANGS